MQITLASGTEIDVPIPPTSGPPKNIPTTADQKAALIVAAIPGASLVAKKGMATQVVLPNGAHVTGDTTNEPMKVADLGLSLPGSPAYATLGFDGSLTAIGTDGSASIFTASFGVDDSIFSSASLSYEQLSSPTADGLVAGLYYELLAGLSQNLKSDLHLDLATDTITFDFAPGSGNYFVETSNTSPGTSQFMNIGGVSSAPEPFTFLSLGTGLILIGTLRRKAGNIVP